MNIAFQLFQIQEIDTAIEKYNKRILEIDEIVSNNSKVSKAESNVESYKKIFIKNTNDFNALSDKIEKKKIKKTQSQSSLYGGKVQNPKELEDLQKEIKSLEKSIESLEESLMDALIDLDNSEKDYENAKKSLKNAKSSSATENSMLTAEKNDLLQKVDGQLKKRSPIYEQISADKQQLYETLRQKKRGIAVTTITDDGCSACGAILTAGQRQSARSSTNIFLCPTCGRIVYGSS